MYRLMLFSIIVLISTLKSKASDTIPDISTVLSEKYLLQFSGSEYSYNKNAAVFKKKIAGEIKKSLDMLFSKSTDIVGIFKDTTIFLIDQKIKIIYVGSKNKNEFPLLSPFYDPSELIVFALKNKAILSKSKDKKTTTYKFCFPDSLHLPVYEISLYFESHLSVNSSFSVKFIFEREGIKIMDVIDYSPTNEFPIKKIEDYLEIKNGQLMPKEIYKNYQFVNWLNM
jgi:hypothetical protein